jgi:hypothetical protein
MTECFIALKPTATMCIKGNSAIRNYALNTNRAMWEKLYKYTKGLGYLEDE